MTPSQEVAMAILIDDMPDSPNNGDRRGEGIPARHGSRHHYYGTTETNGQRTQPTPD